MSSLLTNSSAMVALTTLRGINMDLAETQNRISTGMRVADASDNAAYWSIATTMRADNEAMGAVRDALGLGAATIDVAFTAVDKAVDVMKGMIRDVTTGTDGAVDKGKIHEALSNTQDQLRTFASSASFSGQNWLQQDMATVNLNKEVTGSFNRLNNGQVEIETIKIDTSSITLIDTRATGPNAEPNAGILSKDIVGASAITFVAGTADTPPSATVTAATDSFEGLATVALQKALDKTFAGMTTDQRAAFDDDAAQQLKTDVDAAIAGLGGTSMLDWNVSGLEDSVVGDAVLEAVINSFSGTLGDLADAATDLGSAKARVDMQTEFSKNLSDAIDRGIGQLVDADMNAESTRLQALQTQQQLGIQALSIANSGAQNILSLFR